MVCESYCEGLNASTDSPESPPIPAPIILQRANSITSLDANELRERQQHLRHLPACPEDPSPERAADHAESKETKDAPLMESRPHAHTLARGSSSDRLLRMRTLSPNPAFLMEETNEELGGSMHTMERKHAVTDKSHEHHTFWGGVLHCSLAVGFAALILDTFCLRLLHLTGFVVFGFAVVVVLVLDARRALCGLRDHDESPCPEVDWKQRLRLFVGDTGVQVFSWSGAQLPPVTATSSFRDSLLEYANKFWATQIPQRAPSPAMVLEVIDYGDLETKGEDGKVLKQAQKVPMFIPLDSERAEHLLSVGTTTSSDKDERKRSCGGLTKFPEKLSRLTCGFSGTVLGGKKLLKKRPCRGGPDDVGADESDLCYAPLTPSGDIRLGTGMPDPAPVKIDEDGKRGKSAGPDGAAQPTMILDVYGEDGFEKVQRLIQDVLCSSSSRPMPNKLEPEAHKQLYWYTLADWGGDDNRGSNAPRPRFRKTPIYGDRDYQMNYHYSFFHPKKNQLLGTSYSLLDQFRDRTGNYAVRGAQQKLNFLLHGPPGTGKSKFVRTVAMYLQRHVVSFTMTQVETEIQFLTLIDDLNAITDRRAGEDESYTFKDLLFVVEEIDTDPRGICLQRSTSDALPIAPVTLASEAEGEEEEADDTKSKKQSGRGKGAKSRQQSASKVTSPPLSLGLILRSLDGSSETPGRIIIMTTNRPELLDEAFKRPGRMKKVKMDNLAYPEFKQMILHFRQSEGKVPTTHLWTVSVDKMAQHIMQDYQVLHANRTGDLDRRGLGLSPALLEELCMESQTLEQLFRLLTQELENQWGKAEELRSQPQPCSIAEVRQFDWRMNSMRQTMLFYIKDPKKHVDACRSWPDTAMVDAKTSVLDDHSGRSEGDVASCVRLMLEDEDKFNEALEHCPCDYTHLYPDLKYRLQLELALGVSPLDASAGVGSALALLMTELKQKWRLAWNVGDMELQALLGSELPPSCTEIPKFPALSHSRSFIERSDPP